MFPRASTAWLAAIVCGFLVLLNLQWSPDWLGYMHDDSIYWSSGKALAGGEGYIMPSVPGAPAQSKYPFGYPFLLSLVWWLWPTFPDNLYPAFWLTALFGCVFVVGSYFLVRQLGIDKPAALAICAVCGLHPVTVTLSTSLLSDMPFTALAVGSSVLAWIGLKDSRASGRAGKSWWFAAVLAAAAALTRSVGITAVVGMAAFGVIRKAYRPAAVVFLAGLAAFAGGLWWPPGEQAVLAAPESGLSGYQQTLLYYTSYASFWRLCVPDWATVWSLTKFNFAELVKHPAAAAFLLPVVGFSGGYLKLAAVTLSVGIVKGLIGLAHGRGWHPAHFMLLATLPVVLAWNYVLLDRFLLPFLPLFLAGAYGEIRSITSSVIEVFRARKPLVDRAVSLLLLGVVACLLIYSARNYVRSPFGLRASRIARSSLAVDKKLAYRWIRENTDPADRYVAYEDVNLWLYTGRQALRPMAFSTQAFFLQDKSVLDRDLERFMDTADAIEARYWLVAEDDFHLDSAEEMINQHVQRLLSRFPKVFETEGQRVAVYEIASDGA